MSFKDKWTDYLLTHCKPHRMPLVGELAKVPLFCFVIFLLFLLLSYVIVIDMLLSVLLFSSGKYWTHSAGVGSLFILDMVSSVSAVFGLSCYVKLL